MGSQAMQEVRDFVQRSSLALLTTRDTLGLVHSQPVSPTCSPADDEVWFIVDPGTALSRQIANHPEVMVTCVQPSRTRCLMLVGTGQLHDVPQRPPPTTMGLGLVRSAEDDEGACVLRVRPISADLWE